MDALKNGGLKGGLKLSKPTVESIWRYEKEVKEARRLAREKFKLPAGENSYGSPNYMFNQKMGDAAYERYKSAPSKNEGHLAVAWFYYDRALRLARKRTEEGSLPRGGRKQLRRRIDYCEGALGVVRSEVEE